MQLPSPREIFSRFEKGECDRDEVHAMMALHARELIGEMEEDHQNPAAALIEMLLARRLAGRLARRVGGAIVREILVALSEVEDFSEARYLWNAAHPDVPLHCFFRMRREPLFKIVSIRSEGDVFQVAVEHGSAEKKRSGRRSFRLKRDGEWRLRVVG